MRIDAHQHFWRYDAREYAWIGADKAVLRRDFLPRDLRPLLQAEGMDGTIVVQVRQTLEESYWLLDLAGQSSLIKGVVGWVDLRSPSVATQLADLSKRPQFRGVRHILQDEAQDRFMLQEDFVHGLAQLAKFGLTYDLLLYPRHLPVALELVERFHDQRFVIDHISKPGIKQHTLEPWKSDFKRLAQFPNVWCKVSGMVTEADWGNWKARDFRPYLDVAFESFGPHRLMVGSDWPVCTLAASYHQVLEIVSDYTAQLPQEGHKAVWGGNAARFYGINESA